MRLLELSNSTSLVPEVQLGTGFAPKVSLGAGGRQPPCSLLGGSVPPATEALRGIFLAQSWWCVLVFLKRERSVRVLLTVKPPS